MHRCRILAKALVDILGSERSHPQQEVERISQFFTRNGISLEKPYLNPSSNDIYQEIVTQFSSQLMPSIY